LLGNHKQLNWTLYSILCTLSYRPDLLPSNVLL